VRLGAIVRDPLVPFLIVGVFCYTLFAARESDDARVVTVTPAIRASLAEDHLIMQGRAATEAELDALVERWVADEILFREALDRELHLGDARTRHRLVDTMRFLLVAEPTPPPPDALLEFYLAHMDDYRTEWRISFDSRFWGEAEQIPDDALERLRAGETLTSEAYWLGDRFEDYHLSMLRSLFGGKGARGLLEAPLDEWIGPIPSPRGLHIVRVTDRVEPRPIPFDEARDRLAEDWIAAERRARLDSALVELRTGYDVRTDG
jgi:peptidyl-prolyl cis-trans isomerase C